MRSKPLWMPTAALHYRAVTMEPLDLHYSRPRLIRNALFCLLFTALGSWFALGGVGDSGDGRGRRAAIGRMLGPEGVQILGWTIAAATLVLALLYLRRAFADLVAARADAGGVAIHTLFGSHVYAARDLERIELRRPAGQLILQIVPATGRGKSRGIPVNGLAESEDEVAAWIEAAGAALAADRGGGRCG